VSIACTGCGQSPIPLVPIGSLRNFIKARRYLESLPAVNVAVVDTSVARSGIRLFLRTRTGQAVVAAMASAIGIKLVTTPEKIDEALMRDIEEFLKRQLSQRNKKGVPPIGVAVPLNPRRRKRQDQTRPLTGPDIREGIETLLDPFINPEKEEPDDERKKRTRQWFERRWRNSPGLAFALKNKRERARFTRGGRRK